MSVRKFRFGPQLLDTVVVLLLLRTYRGITHPKERWVALRCWR